MALDRGSGQLFWVPSPDHHVLGQAARALTSAGYEPNFHRAAPATIALILTGALLLVALLVIAVSGRGRMPYGRRVAELLVALWFVVPVLVAVIAAKAGVPVELSRATLLVLPAVALLLAWLCAHPRVPLVLGWLAVALLLVLRALTLAPTYGVSPEPWNAATASVVASSPRGACVAFYPQDGRMPFDYYLDAGAVPGAGRLTPVYPATPWSVVVPYIERYELPAGPQLNAIVRRCPVLWLVSSHEGQRAARRPLAPTTVAMRRFSPRWRSGMHASADTRSDGPPSSERPASARPGGAENRREASLSEADELGAPLPQRFREDLVPGLGAWLRDLLVDDVLAGEAGGLVGECEPHERAGATLGLAEEWSGERRSELPDPALVLAETGRARRRGENSSRGAPDGAARARG